MNILVAISLLFIDSFSPCAVDELSWSANDESLTNTPYIAAADYLTEQEKSMVWEVNLVRSRPSAYLSIVQDKLDETIRDSVRLSAIRSETIRKRVTYIEDREVVEYDTTYNNYYETRVSAMRELLDELRSTEPMAELYPSDVLYFVATKHGNEQARHDYIDHMGADGSWPLERMQSEAKWIVDGNENIARGMGSPRDIVLQLLIDSGVPTRGHRNNILNPEWKYVACHNVDRLNDHDMKWWLQEFAY